MDYTCSLQFTLCKIIKNVLEAIILGSALQYLCQRINERSMTQSRLIQTQIKYILLVSSFCIRNEFLNKKQRQYRVVFNGQVSQLLSSPHKALWTRVVGQGRLLWLTQLQNLTSTALLRLDKVVRKLTTRQRLCDFNTKCRLSVLMSVSPADLVNGV